MTQGLIKKFNNIRHQNWSAPVIMSVFLLICMIIIFSFESLGLTNKERNLDYRLISPERQIRIVSGEIKRTNSGEITQPKDTVLNKIKIITKKDKETHILSILKLLHESAEFQLKYEEDNSNSTKINFCDI